MDTFGERLQHVMRVKKINVKTLATQVGCHSSQVSRWRRASGPPEQLTSDKIASILQCDQDWLYTGQGEPFHNHITQHHIGQAVALQHSTTGNITTTSHAAPPPQGVPLLTEITAWLEAMEAQRPGFKGWFTIEFPNRFAEFEEWRVEQCGN